MNIVKCPNCKKEMREFSSITGLVRDFWCINKNCLFFKIKRTYDNKDLGDKK